MRGVERSETAWTRVVASHRAPARSRSTVVANAMTPSPQGGEGAAFPFTRSRVAIRFAASISASADFPSWNVTIESGIPIKTSGQGLPTPR
jgi:hypothetical protein